MPPKGWKKQTTKQQDIDKLVADTPLPEKPTDMPLAEQVREKERKNAEENSELPMVLDNGGKPCAVGLTPQQERFVYEFVKDYDRIEALRRAGYAVQNLNTAQVQASRMLRMPVVMQLIDDIQCAILATNMMDANWAIVRFKLTYMKALNDRDYGNALRALENISKFLGLYERHNKQKKYTADDINELRGELEQAGFNFEITAQEKLMVSAKGGQLLRSLEDTLAPRVVDVSVTSESNKE